MTGKSGQQFDFDEWASLAVADPDAFEARRVEVIEGFISRVPRDRQQRLRSLQWRIDRTRELSPTPTAACVRLSRMMWDSLLGEQGLLETLERMRSGRFMMNDRPTARIIPFRRPDSLATRDE